MSKIFFTCFISDMNTINFTANFIKNTSILKRDKGLNYKKENVAVVELDIKDKRDLKSLYDASVQWNLNGGKHISCIFSDALKPSSYPDITAEHYLALTKQKDNYKNLNSEDIIGVALFSETKNNENELNYLEVRPDLKTDKYRIRDYKRIGTALVDYIKDTFSEKDIFLYSDENAIEFYRKNKFESLSENFPYHMFYYVE